ncbi:MAG: single-stranded DNA-binding protein [Terriglobales bacterium]
MNNVSIVGNLGLLPEYTMFPSGKQKASFSLALNRGKDAQGNPIPPIWVECKLWDKSVDHLRKFTMQKGALIGIEGSLSSSDWKQQVGDRVVNRTKHFVRVSKFTVLSRKVADQAELSAPEGSEESEPASEE